MIWPLILWRVSWVYPFLHRYLWSLRFVHGLKSIYIPASQTVRNENPVPAMRYQVQRSCRELSLKDLKPRGHLDSSKWVPPPQWNLYLYSPIQHQSTYRLIFIINPTFVNRTYSHVWWWNPDFQNYQSPILSCLNPHVLYHISYLIIVKHPIHILNNSPFFIQSFILGIYTFILYIYICIYWLPILYLSLPAPFLFTMNFSSRQGSARICPCAKRRCGLGTVMARGPSDEDHCTK